MKLNDYLKMVKKKRSHFAKENGISAGYITKIIEYGAIPTPDMALKIEQATNGKVKKMELLYP
jgi:hypothetical protein